MSEHRLIHGDCLTFLHETEQRSKTWTCVFADPPDNIGLRYNEHTDSRPDDEYLKWLDNCLYFSMWRAEIVWFSFNARWIFDMGKIIENILRGDPDLEAKLCVQTFTFGQHNHHDLGNNYRPLLRMKEKSAPLYPDAIRVPSWRQKNGDKRADPRGRVPGDVFDFSRVTGNSRQRRPWHPTQLHEGLVERCIKLSTKEGDSVLDPFGGTGTVLRVCKRLGRPCTTIEIDRNYCERIAEEHYLEIEEYQNDA